MTLAVREHESPPAAHLRVSPRWAKLLRRLMALQNDRHQVIITVVDGAPVDWSVAEVGKVER